MFLIWTPISTRGLVILMPLDICTSPVPWIGSPGRRVKRSCVIKACSNHVSIMNDGACVNVVILTGSKTEHSIRS
ncbi:MAG TPA: hypothetical protein VJH03_22355 [Blastocatellia bacterium]|nr:hypothetical protein [Blastocatellia bacterium]